MLTYIKGNLLESSAQALVNTVNTVGVMGKGLALQFKEAFPDNFRIYREVCQKKALHIGQMLVTEEKTLHGTKTIINFPTKESWRKPSTYDFIEKGLAALRLEILNRKISSIAIPPLGARNGGLDWNIVKKMIEDYLSDLNCEIQLYEPNEMILDRLKAERVKLTPARAMMLDVMYDMVYQGELVSEFAAEKIVYFLQRFGAQKEFKLNYNHGFYGPYSGKVRYVLRYLNGSYVMGLVEMNQKPFEPIWVIADGRIEVQNYLEKEEFLSYSQISKVTKDFLDGYYSNFSLELLATVDFILQSDPNLTGWLNKDMNVITNIILEDISKWSNRKRNLFGKESYIHIMLNHLKEWQSRMI